MEQISNQLNSLIKVVGATLVVARTGPADAWTAGRDKPVPYDRCSLHVRAPAPGVETRMEQILNPLNCEAFRRGDPCGRPRRNSRLTRATGRDKPVPYDR